MPCIPVEIGDDGKVAIVCIRGRRSRAIACSVPQCGRPGTLLCDHPAVQAAGEVQKTCDRLVCTRHAVSIGPDQHHCLEHA